MTAKHATGTKKDARSAPDEVRRFASHVKSIMGTSEKNTLSFAPNLKPGLDRIKNAASDFIESLGYRQIGNLGKYEIVNKNDKRIALFAHAGFGLTFLSFILGIPYPLFATHFDLGHSGMTVIEFQEIDGYAYPKVLTLSSDSHLYKEGLPTRYNNRIAF